MYYLIDPPVTPYSPPAEIERWICQLEAFEQTPEVKDEMERAAEWLEHSRKMYNDIKK